MKKYIINDHLIEAKSIKDAVCIYKNTKNIKDAVFRYKNIRDRDYIAYIMKSKRELGTVTKEDNGLYYTSAQPGKHFSSKEEALRFSEQKGWKQIDENTWKQYDKMYGYWDSIRDSEKYIAELEEGDIIIKTDGSKWEVSAIRPGPFETTVRLNSKHSPVQTREITYKSSDKVMVEDSIKDADWDFMNKIRNYPTSKIIIALKNIGRYSRFGENFTWADLAGKLNTSEKDKFLRELAKIGDSVKDYDAPNFSALGRWEWDETKQDWYDTGRKMYASEIEENSKIKFDSIKDEDIDNLSAEEQQAIDDYRKAIQGTNDPKMLALYAHILKEEVEHLEELQNAKEGEFVEDDDLIKLGTRFTINKTGNKEYIVTNTNLGGKGNDREFEYQELMIDGNTRNPNTMKYSDFKCRSDIHIL